MSTSETPAITGRTLGAFVVGELLGEGGMGAVFNGRDKALDRPVAIKVLHTKLAADEEFVERFVREARTAAKLNHPNVVQIYGAGYDAGIAYMALELVEGCSLFDLYKAQRPFPPRRACELIRDVSRGLAVAHEQGVIHRDLKPENILISEKGVPKVADFGLARASDQRITETGIFLGTPQYASPEQCNAAELTPASDLYSLGVVLYELLAGRPPYEAPTPLTLFKKILMESPEPLANYCPNLPPSLIALIDRLLEKDPAKRYSDAGVLAKDLDHVLQGLPEVSEDMDPYKLVPVVHADSRTVQTPTPAKDSSRNLPFQETHGTTPLAPTPSDELRSLKYAQWALAAAAAVLVCAVLGLGLARLRGKTEPAVGPTQPALTQPLRVAVIPWSNQAQSADFEWLGRALPDFLVSQLSQRPDAIRVEPPANVIDAIKDLDLSDPSHRRALAQSLKVDLVIGGSFYVGAGGHVVLNAQVETDEGMPKQIPGSPATFAKEEVLGALNSFAEALARAIAGPSADTRVVAEAPSGAEAETAMAKEAAPAQAPRSRKVSAPEADKAEEDLASREELAELEGAQARSERGRGEASAKEKASSALSKPQAPRAAGAKVPAKKEVPQKEVAEKKVAEKKVESSEGYLEQGGDAQAQGGETPGADGGQSLGGGGGQAGAASPPQDARKRRPGRANWAGRQAENDEETRPQKDESQQDQLPRASSVASVGSQEPAEQDGVAAKQDAKGALAPELRELRECLSKGKNWETYKALDACSQSQDEAVLRGALEALGENTDNVSELFRNKLRAKLAR